MASRQLVVFTMDEQEYGIDVVTVEGILQAKKFKIQLLPGMPASIEGIINLRGQIKYLYNLRNKFKLKESTPAEESKFVMLNVNDGKAGWIVDEVTDIVRIDDEDLEKTPGCINGGSDRYIESIGKIDERLIIILDPEKVLEQDIIEAIEKLDDAAV